MGWKDLAAGILYDSPMLQGHINIPAAEISLYHLSVRVLRELPCFIWHRCLIRFETIQLLFTTNVIKYLNRRSIFVLFTYKKVLDDV